MFLVRILYIRVWMNWGFLDFWFGRCYGLGIFNKEVGVLGFG